MTEKCLEPVGWIKVIESVKVFTMICQNAEKKSSISLLWSAATDWQPSRQMRCTVQINRVESVFKQEHHNILWRFLFSAIRLQPFYPVRKKNSYQCGLKLQQFYSFYIIHPFFCSLLPIQLRIGLSGAHSSCHRARSGILLNNNYIKYFTNWAVLYTLKPIRLFIYLLLLSV